jgi:hypothetical protein
MVKKSHAKYCLKIWKCKKPKGNFIGLYIALRLLSLWCHTSLGGMWKKFLGNMKVT